MFSPYKIFLIIVSLCVVYKAYSQTPHSKILYISNTNNDSLKIPAAYILTGIFRPACKYVYAVFSDTSTNYIKAIPKKIIAVTNQEKKPAFITMHGNVMYDYFYQSYLDTPYTGSPFQQHTISTYIDLTVKNDYPLKLYFTARFGNTNYLKELNSLNLRFDEPGFTRNAKQKLQSWLTQQMNADSSPIQKMKNEYLTKLEEYKKIKSWLASASVLQMLIAAREKQMAQKNLNVTNVDSNANNILIQYAKEQAQSDSLKKAADSLWTNYLTEKNKWDSTKNALTSSLSDLKNNKNWQQSLKKISGADSILPKGYNILSNVSKLGLGTSVVDYSELSAKNITITGLQVEYAPKLYYAVAGGVIDYRFRDYLLPEAAGAKQYLGLVRFGRGKPESDHLIFTYYFGRKNLYNYYISDSSGAQSNPNFSLMGITIEKQISLTKNINISAEAAKSTLPYYNRINQTSKIAAGAFNFNNHSNEAYALKATAAFPSTHTNVDGYYKRYGENFQSFTLFSTNTRQTAWLIHVEQSFIKNQLTVNASLRKNDYVNPFINQQYTSNILFKSIQLTLRKRKLPVISVGYYPTSQLIKLADNNYTENLFYNLIGSMFYYYNLFGMQMSSSVIATRFYNKQPDSGFVYFNARNIIADHNIYLRNFTLNAGFSQSFTNHYNLYTITGGLQWKLKKWLLAGGSVNYNRQSIIAGSQIGYSLNSSVAIPFVGNIQLRIQKSYVPGPDAVLIPDNIGRLTYFRNF